MAAPRVSGYVAYLLSLDSSLTPAVDSTIKSKVLKGVLTGIRMYTNFSVSHGIHYPFQ